MSSSLIVLTDFAKAMATVLDNTNSNVWSTEVVRAFQMRHCAHYISMDGGIYQHFAEHISHLCLKG